MSLTSMRQTDVMFAPDTPAELQSILSEAVVLYEDTERAEAALWRAFDLAPDRSEVYVALYKFYFYKNRIEEAEKVVHMALNKAAIQGGFWADWNDLTPASAQWSPAGPSERFFLYSLKALAFISLRQERSELAGEILAKLLELDPDDQVGASVINDLHQGLAA